MKGVKQKKKKTGACVWVMWVCNVHLCAKIAHFEKKNTNSMWQMHFHISTAIHQQKQLRSTLHPVSWAHSYLIQFGCLFCFVFLFQNKCESYMNACSATQWMCNAFCVRSCLIKNAHASNVFVECTRANAHQEFCFSFSFKSSLLFWCKSFFLYAFTPIAVQRIDIERNGMKRNGAKFTNYNKSST